LEEQNQQLIEEIAAYREHEQSANTKVDFEFDRDFSRQEPSQSFGQNTLRLQHSFGGRSENDERRAEQQNSMIEQLTEELHKLQAILIEQEAKFELKDKEIARVKQLLYDAEKKAQAH
jgi:hypothetical protein